MTVMLPMIDQEDKRTMWKPNNVSYIYIYNMLYVIYEGERRDDSVLQK